MSFSDYALVIRASPTSTEWFAAGSLDAQKVAFLDMYFDCGYPIDDEEAGLNFWSLFAKRYDFREECAPNFTELMNNLQVLYFQQGMFFIEEGRKTGQNFGNFGKSQAKRFEKLYAMPTGDMTMVAAQFDITRQKQVLFALARAWIHEVRTSASGALDLIQERAAARGMSLNRYFASIGFFVAMCKHIRFNQVGASLFITKFGAKIISLFVETPRGTAFNGLVRRLDRAVAFANRHIEQNKNTILINALIPAGIFSSVWIDRPDLLRARYQQLVDAMKNEDVGAYKKALIQLFVLLLASATVYTTSLSLETDPIYAPCPILQ
jgi:hypothetical protein